MRTYPEYKDSGVEWIGEIPKGWGVNKLKYSSDLIIEKELPSDGDIKISPENVESFTGKVINYHSDYETEGMKFQKGDTLLNKLRVYLSKFVFCESDGFSMGEMIVFRPREYLPKFQYYLLSNPNIISHFNSLSQGVKVPRPPVDEILNSFCPVVPPSEQKQISDYLDRKTQQIDDLIEKTERKIELLKEQRSSLINQCVTKGLDPNVEMKDSGVEWIGEIPKGWKITRLKYVTSYNDIKLNDNTDPEYEFTYIEISDVDAQGRIGPGTLMNFEESPSRARRVLKKNDVVISTVRTYLRSIGTITENREDLVCSTGFCVLKSRDGLDHKYLSYLVLTEWFIGKVVSNSDGVSYPAINPTDLVALPVIVPLHSEQKQISEHLEKETSKIDQMVDNETKRINLLKEYRQSLISSVVTGKIDVRDEVIQ